MRIEFCGADRTVTGSCHMLELAGQRILLDCGLFQGARDESRRLNQVITPAMAKADAVVLSHGHLDHCGKLPVLTKAGFAGPIYTTSASAEVARIVLEDSAEIQEEDAAYLNRRAVNPGEPPIEPLYRRRDVSQVVKQFRRLEYGQEQQIGDSAWFTFFNAGHILGSAYVVLRWKQGSRMRRLLFTADVGRYRTPIIDDPHLLEEPVDFAITESTYGDRQHASVDEVEPQLLEAVQECVRRQSRLIVPSFAVGRTQSILWYVQKFITEGRIPHIPVFVDSPMGIEVSHVHEKFRQYYDSQTRSLIGQHDLFGLSRVKFAVSREQSQHINSVSGACVIVASSPTCEFGRVLHHLKRSLERPDDMVIFVGWTPYNTLGRKLQDGQTRVRIFNRWYEVKCHVRTIHGLSAHADATELQAFLKPALRGDSVVAVVHGEEDQAEGLARRLCEGGLGSAYVPALGSSVLM